MGAVAAGGVGDGDEDELCVGHLRDHLFCDTKLRGIDEIIGGVDPEDGCGDCGELRCGIVVARGVDVVDEVVSVSTLDVGVDGLVDVCFDLSARWIVFLELKGRAARDD